MSQLTSKEIWKITYPVMISLLMQHMIGVIDTLFLARLGETELGASALGSVYYLSLFMLGFGFSTGAQIIIARRNGEGNLAGIGPVFMQGLLFLVILALACFALVQSFTPQALRLMIRSDDVYQSALVYVDWRSYGYFFSFAILAYRAFFVGTTRTGVLTWNACLMVATNSVLNYLLIFGKCGFPAWGIAGAAIASSITEMVSLVFLTVYTLWRVDWRTYKLFSFAGAQIRLLGSVLKVSLWTMMQSFGAMSVWFVFFLTIERDLGPHDLAISNIVRQISALLYMFTAAFSATASSLVGNVIGSGFNRHVMPLCRRLVRMCFLTQLPFVLLVLLAPFMVLRLFTPDPVLAADAVASLMVMATSYFLHVPALIYLSAVIGTGSTRAAMIVEFITLTIYLFAVLGMISWMKVDVAVAWTTEHVYASIMLVLSYAYMKKGYWIGKKV